MSAEGDSQQPEEKVDPQQYVDAVIQGAVQQDPPGTSMQAQIAAHILQIMSEGGDPGKPAASLRKSLRARIRTPRF